jgi:hypothetical protein
MKMKISFDLNPLFALTLALSRGERVKDLFCG